MTARHKSSSHIQLQAEDELFQEVEKQLNISLAKNPKVSVSEDRRIYMQPDFYSAEHCVIGEIFAHIGKPKKAQDNKIANDILKMLLLEETKGKEYRKILVVCDRSEEKKLNGDSVLAESIRRFGIEIMPIEISNELREKILKAQELQKMTNVE